MGCPLGKWTQTPAVGALRGGYRHRWQSHSLPRLSEEGQIRLVESISQGFVQDMRRWPEACALSDHLRLAFLCCCHHEHNQIGNTPSVSLQTMLNDLLIA